MKWRSRVRLFATPWTIACQAPPSMGFSKQEHWSGLPFPSNLNPAHFQQIPPQEVNTIRQAQPQLPGMNRINKLNFIAHTPPFF